MNDPKTVRCTDCASEFTDVELQGAVGCPSCSSKSIPCSIAQDVTIKINWHELRILTIWADNHARTLPVQSKSTLTSIIRRLEAQKPEGFAALTIFGEVRDLQKSGIDAELQDSSGNVLVPKMVKN